MEMTRERIRFCRNFQLGLLVPAFSSVRASMSSANRKIGNISTAYANLFVKVFKSISHNLVDKDVKESGREKTFLSYSNCCSEPFSCAAVQLNYTCSLVVKLLNGVN